MCSPNIEFIFYIVCANIRFFSFILRKIPHLWRCCCCCFCFAAKGGKNTRQLNLRDHQENNNNRNSNIPMVNGWSIWEWNWNPNFKAFVCSCFSLVSLLFFYTVFHTNDCTSLFFIHTISIQPVFTFQLENSYDWLRWMTMVQTKWNGLQNKTSKCWMKLKQWIQILSFTHAQITLKWPQIRLFKSKSEWKERKERNTY